MTCYDTEKMTQRGYENFGAVMDSVAAVIVAIVNNALMAQQSTPSKKNSQWERIKDGYGVGKGAVSKYESSISRTNAEAAISCLKAAGQNAVAIYHNIVD